MICESLKFPGEKGGPALTLSFVSCLIERGKKMHFACKRGVPIVVRIHYTHSPAIPPLKIPRDFFKLQREQSFLLSWVRLLVGNRRPVVPFLESLWEELLLNASLIYFYVSNLPLLCNCHKNRWERPFTLHKESSFYLIRRALFGLCQSKITMRGFEIEVTPLPRLLFPFQEFGPKVLSCKNKVSKWCMPKRNVILISPKWDVSNYKRKMGRLIYIEFHKLTSMELCQLNDVVPQPLQLNFITHTLVGALLKLCQPLIWSDFRELRLARGICKA